MLQRSPPRVARTIFNEGVQANWNGRRVWKRASADSLGQPSAAFLATLNYVTYICLPAPDEGGGQARNFTRKRAAVDSEGEKWVLWQEGYRTLLMA